METRVQYARTTDDVDIAFAVHGDGLPLVFPPNLATHHLQLEAEDGRPLSSFFARLAKRLQVIRYDARGGGMSQRDRIDFSPEAAGRDLSAVVDRLGLERVALYTYTLAGEGPLAFAANHPERVSSLTCWVGDTAAIQPDVRRRVASIAHLQTEDWELYCNITCRLLAGWDSPHATSYAAMMRAGSSPEVRPLAMEAVSKSYRGDWASRVRVPTLLCHIAGADRSARIARGLAATIPGAQIVAIPAVDTGRAYGVSPIFYDSEILAAAIADFVEATSANPTAPARAPELRLSVMRAILWTDIESHTALMQRFGDDKGRELLREHERITREALSANGGTEVKAMGDGFMAWFSSAQQAVECAVALQRAFAARNASGAEPMLVRSAINAGEPIAEDDDLFGASVIAAARICSEAAGGEIVASDVVRQLVAGKGFSFVERGDVLLKGFDDTIRLYEVRWQEK